MIKTICVAGAGTMGSGIATLAAQNGFDVLLFDVNREVLEKAGVGIRDNINQLVNKQKIAWPAGESILKKIQLISDPQQCIADFFIEAIVEKAVAKIELFAQFAAINSASVVFATNTSSLSVSHIQQRVIHPERVAGMHFFNPAPVMKLVEVVKGTLTSEAAIQTIFGLCKTMGKVPVLCNDAPGFIVNRVARQYYLEAMKLVESGIASVEQVDMIMEGMGFKLGPFKLMDLIGMDINLAVSNSIYEALNQPVRLAPSALQLQKVASGQLGRKTGQGFYTYTL